MPSLPPANPGGTSAEKRLKILDAPDASSLFEVNPGPAGRQVGVTAPSARGSGGGFGRVPALAMQLRMPLAIALDGLTALSGTAYIGSGTGVAGWIAA